jgi:hypothetical protein
MIDILQNSWKAAGQEVGKIGKTEGLNIVKTVEEAHSMFGRTVNVEKNTVRVSTCPIWDRILAGQLEYGFRCEEFICAPYLTGIKDALGAKEAGVETNLRLAHVARVRLEYKLNKLKSGSISDPQVKAQIAELEVQIKQLPVEPACIFHVK